MRTERVNVRIITPAPRGSTTGNRVTAERWARIIRTLGHHVRVSTNDSLEACDVLVALHARKSASAVTRFKSAHPDAPVIVCLTGTDLYGDLHKPAVRRTLALATRVVALHPSAAAQLPQHMQSKLRVIYQSAPRRRRPPRHKRKRFRVCVLGHLRRVKDPFRAAMAARRLPSASRIMIVQVGAALTGSMERRALAEQRRNPRFVWLRERSRSQAMRILSTSDLLVLSSRSEGGANVISEAVMSSVPVLASRIACAVDLLGADYPGLFAVGNTVELRSLMLRAESDRPFYRDLEQRLGPVKTLFDPRRERRSWRALLEELSDASA